MTPVYLYFTLHMDNANLTDVVASLGLAVTSFLEAPDQALRLEELWDNASVLKAILQGWITASY